MVKQNSKRLTVFVFLLIFSGGCAKRVFINYNEVKPNALVTIETKNGKSCEGIIQAKKPSFLVMQLNKFNKSLTKIERENIYQISGQKEYILDTQNKVISEWEIESKKNNNNFLLYTLGGGGLSFGLSFFLGSLINRSMDDIDQGKTAMCSTAAGGTVLGTILFASAGAKRDRHVAIEKIRDQRIELAKKHTQQERLKRKKIQEELEKLKAERKKQEEEILRLKNKAKKK